MAGHITRAKIPRGALATFSGCSRGLDAGILRLTRGAVLTGVTGYDLAVFGSGAYERDLRALET